MALDNACDIAKILSSYAGYSNGAEEYKQCKEIWCKSNDESLFEVNMLLAMGEVYAYRRRKWDSRFEGLNKRADTYKKKWMLDNAPEAYEGMPEDVIICFMKDRWLEYRNSLLLNISEEIRDLNIQETKT